MCIGISYVLESVRLSNRHQPPPSTPSNNTKKQHDNGEQSTALVFGAVFLRTIAVALWVFALKFHRAKSRWIARKKFVLPLTPSTPPSPYRPGTPQQTHLSNDQLNIEVSEIDGIDNGDSAMEWGTSGLSFFGKDDEDPFALLWESCCVNLVACLIEMILLLLVFNVPERVIPLNAILAIRVLRLIPLFSIGFSIIYPNRVMPLDGSSESVESEPLLPPPCQFPESSPTIRNRSDSPPNSLRSHSIESFDVFYDARESNSRSDSLTTPSSEPPASTHTPELIRRGNLNMKSLIWAIPLISATLFLEPSMIISWFKYWLGESAEKYDASCLFLGGWMSWLEVIVWIGCWSVAIVGVGLWREFVAVKQKWVNVSVLRVRNTFFIRR
ncbi:hypothetical protein BDR26DRAFT_866341 [Obelidium mucronatum]|nr:hypothetical protein BDR26DRAFT_866341 [Obelidium mucronatum]